MSEYKLVPVDPTQEMVEAARQHHEGEAYLPVSLYKAMLAGAPAVQGEPVATIHVDGSFVHVAWRIPAPSRCAMDVYAAAQPAEQQPDTTQLVEALDLALEYWRDRQQRYKNRRPKWVIAAESALAAHRKGAQP